LPRLIHGTLLHVVSALNIVARGVATEICEQGLNALIFAAHQARRVGSAAAVGAISTRSAEIRARSIDTVLTNAITR